MTFPRSTPEQLLELLMGADAFLLDYNGTISDDEELCARLFSEIADERCTVALSRERYYSEFVGMQEELVFAQLLQESPRPHDTPSELMREFNRRYLECFRSECTIAPGAISFVKAAHALGRRLMLVTAASRDVVVPALEAAGISTCFEGVIGLEDVRYSKPSSECYLKALRVLGVAAEHALAFEDSRTGIAAAQGAHLATVGVLGSINEPELLKLTPHVIGALDPTLFGEQTVASFQR